MAFFVSVFWSHKVVQKCRPPVIWLPVPVPDPDRPAHFMKAEDLIHGKDKCPADVISIPLSAVIKQAAKDDDVLHNVEGLAQKLLLPMHEVKWHLDYHRQILDKCKWKKKKGGDCSATPDGISCNVKADLSCASEQCSDSYCLKCLILEYPPPLEWMCHNCKDETPLYCLCQQGEFGVMGVMRMTVPLSGFICNASSLAECQQQKSGSVLIVN